MALNSKQEEAVKYLEGPLLVLAGPGTGKTQLLSSKVEYILKNTDATPESILCLTFTENGASNMRERLKSIIGPSANKVNIHTYHAFGSDILAKYKNYATNFDRNLDSSIDTVTQYKIIKNIQDSLDPLDILKGDNIKDIIDTISSAKSARLDSTDLDKIADDNIEATAILNAEINPYLKNIKRAMKFDVGVETVYQPILETLLKHSDTTPITKNIEKEANHLARELSEIIDSESKKEKPSISPLTSWKNKRFELDKNGNFRLKNIIANKKLKSLANVMRRYEDTLEETGLFDFADMISQAIKILKEDRGFKLTLEEQYQYILLDEFQDTNTAQAELIYELTDYEKPLIMAVGDDDQAIFAFQGANASNLLEFQNHYRAKVITLTENYRSSLPILDTSFKIREQVAESFAKAHNIIKRLTAHKTETADISRHEFIEASAEYHFIAEKISELIKSGVKQSEIAIITPKHKYVTDLLPYLKAKENINIAYEKRDDVLMDEKIHELTLLAKFIYELSQKRDPSDQLLEILSFPFFELEPSTILAAINKRDKKTTLEFLAQSDDKKLQNMAEFFAIMVEKSFNTPLELFFDTLIGTENYQADQKSPFLDYYTEKDSDFNVFSLYENLHVLREAVKKHTNLEASKNQTDKKTLKDLVIFLDDYTVAGESLTNTSPYQDAADAIQILTAHKSKGLEFEYVFLVSTDDRAWGNAKGNNNFLSLPQNLIEIRHTGVTEDERLRLFFVAITRAKTHLMMTNSLKDFSGKEPGHLEYLAEYENEQGQLISPHLPQSAQIVSRHYDNLPDDKKLADLKSSWLRNYSTTNGNLKDLLRKRLENYKLTATDLTSFIDIVYAGPQTFYKNRILNAPEAAFSEQLTFGNLIHATFEQVTNNNLTDTEALEYFKTIANSATIPPEKLDSIIEKGVKSLEKSLATFGALLKDKNARAEVNLAHEHLNLNGTPLTGKIDHININEAEKTLEIYDFKTSGFTDKGWTSHATLYKYMLQLGFYKLLLNLSPTYSKYKITKAHILFVVPDSADSEVHDKVYLYNDKDESELKSLIAAIYPLIKSLDFVENPEIFVENDSKKGIKDIKDFAQKILDINQN